MKSPSGSKRRYSSSEHSSSDRNRSKSPHRSGSKRRRTKRSRKSNIDRRIHRKENIDQMRKEEKKNKQENDRVSIRNRTGGAYIPPAKLKMLQDQITDKTSEEYQRLNWERLKKKIHGQVNKANKSNLVQIVRDLLQENIIRGKGLFARSVIQAQAFSPIFSNVYAALVAVINSKLPDIGELILKRLIIQFKRTFRRNDKSLTLNIVKFIAHLVNQQVAHEILALEMCVLLLENPTDDSVEVAIGFLKECGAKLSALTPQGINSIFDQLRGLLVDSEIDIRIQYMIEVLIAIRKEKFSGYPALEEGLDLIEENEQIIHSLSLEENLNPENELNIFKYDSDFEKNEEFYTEIKNEILGNDEEEEDEEEADVDAESVAGSDNQDEEKKSITIIDNTEQNLVAFRRNVYLVIQSSLDYREAAHKLLKLDLKTGQDVELCHMIVDTCAQQRTYERFFGLLAELFCRLRKEFQEAFEQIACNTYNTIHRFDITKLRNMARFVAHLLCTDAISWNVLSVISLNEDDTTSCGRIYLKHLFQEMAGYLGAEKLLERFRDPTMQSSFEKIFPRDNANNTRFSINFFTSINLGYLSFDLREYFKKTLKKRKTSDLDSDDSSDSSSDSDSNSESDSESSETSSSASSSSSSSSSQVVTKKTKEHEAARRDKHRKSPSRKVLNREIKEEPQSPETHVEKDNSNLKRRNVKEKENQNKDHATSRKNRDYNREESRKHHSKNEKQRVSSKERNSGRRE